MVFHQTPAVVHVHTKTLLFSRICRTCFLFLYLVVTSICEFHRKLHCFSTPSTPPANTRLHTWLRFIVVFVFFILPFLLPDFHFVELIDSFCSLHLFSGFFSHSFFPCGFTFLTDTCPTLLPYTSFHSFFVLLRHTPKFPDIPPRFPSLRTSFLQLHHLYVLYL